MQEKGEISRRDFLRFFTQFSGSLLLGVTGIKNLLDGNITRGVFTSGDQQGQNTPIPTSTWKPTKTSIPTITRRPPATATPMPSATSTRKPYPTPSSTVTPIPTADRATPTYTASPLPSPTPDLRGMTDPNFDNFELTIGHLALAINAVSVMQAGRNEIDMTDIVEDFLNFNPEKYQAYLRGERPYRYLKFQEVKKSDDPDAPTQIRAVIVVTNSFHGQNDREYLDLILNYLQTVLKVSMHRINEEKKSQIMRDIGESNRFTCIKFLRFVWSLFGEDPNTEMGLFPEVYQARIVNAGELERQVAGNKSIFDPAFAGIVKPTLIKNALAISGDPEDEPDLFDGKVMVFFRQPAFKGESGHVGVGKLTAQRDKNGDLIRFLISFIEVDGNTGQAYSGYRVYMDDFRAHLFMGTQTKEGFTARKAGWMFLTE